MLDRLSQIISDIGFLKMNLLTIRLCGMQKITHPVYPCVRLPPCCTLLVVVTDSVNNFMTGAFISVNFFLYNILKISLSTLSKFL